MTTLSTGDSQVNRDNKISAFMSVLHCSHEEAVFFLESSVWNIETAIHLWLDAGNGKRHRHPTQEHSKFQDNHKPFPRLQVFIDGLDPAWTAWTSRSNGTVYFLHNDTGITQSQMPSTSNPELPGLIPLAAKSIFPSPALAGGGKEVFSRDSVSEENDARDECTGDAMDAPSSASQPEGLAVHTDGEMASSLTEVDNSIYVEADGTSDMGISEA